MARPEVYRVRASWVQKAKSGSPIALFQAINHHHENMDDGTSRLRLTGREANGTEWHCGWTMPRKIVFGEFSVDGKLTSLNVDQPLATPVSSTEMIFHADYLHPLARVMGGRNRIKQQQIEILGSKNRIRI